MKPATAVLRAVHGEGWRPVAQPAKQSNQVSDWMEEARRPVRQEVAFYRKYTEALLQRFMKMSLQMGRVPSVLGIDPLRGKVTSYRVSSFEDAVIFVVDVEKCLKKTSSKTQAVLVRMSLQEFTVAETAKLLKVTEKTVVAQYRAGLDELTEILLGVGLLKPERLS